MPHSQRGLEPTQGSAPWDGKHGPRALCSVPEGGMGFGRGGNDKAVVMSSKESLKGQVSAAASLASFLKKEERKHQLTPPSRK